MSAAPKPRGNRESELLKLKLLDPAKQDTIWSWRSEMVDNKPLTNAAIRNRIAERFGIRLQRDPQLSQFWSWYQSRQDLEQSNDFLEQMEEFLAKQNEDWAPERVRDAAMTFFLAQAAAKKDPDQFVMILDRDQKERHGTTKAALEQRKLELAEEKFHFDAAKKCLEKLPELKAISERPKLSDEEKAKAIQQILFPK